MTVCQKMSEIVKTLKNCQKCQNSPKIVQTIKNCQKLLKLLKIVKKNCQNVGQVMFPHHSDQMSERSHCQVSWFTL